MTREAVRPLFSLVAVCALGACVSTIKQDAQTGPDGRAKGALKINLDDQGEGTSKGVVTYPGGDRVDWKVFEVAKTSDAEVTLKWTPPRPNLDLSMTVLDDTYHVVKRIAPPIQAGCPALWDYLAPRLEAAREAGLFGAD